MMKFVKLFEDFDQGNLASAGSKSYIYHISNNSDTKFEASVRDQDGKIIYELQASDLQNDGHMKDKNDITGLVKLLVSKNKIKEGETVVSSSQARADSEEFGAAINTNMGS